jgi:hypothetical protein
VTERKTDPPTGTRSSGSPRPPHRVPADQYEIRIRWEKARKVLEVTSGGVKFEFENSLKVGLTYPITLTAPGVSLTSTLEVTRCQLTVASGRFFLIEGRFFPYVE